MYNFTKYILLVFVVLSLALVGCSKTENKQDTKKPDSEQTEVNKTEEPQEPDVEEHEETPLGYIAPDGWYKPTFKTGKVEGGGYTVTTEVMGLKVYMLQKKFELLPDTWGYYRDEVFTYVMWFQEENDIIATGDVDLNTWLKLGFTEKDWYEIGTYVSPVRIKREYDREQIIDTFIKTADEYLGTPFVVGASGKPGEGVDCSGLVLQCLYAIGIYPDGLDPVQHSTEEEYNSRLMWADPKFKKINYFELERGDLVFYKRPWSNSVCHVAIYTGNDECIEALYDEVEYLPLNKVKDGYRIMGYKRVIAD